METKYRVAVLGELRLAPGVVGAVERWTKLSLDAEATVFHPARRWCAVEKDRRLRRFAFVRGRATEVPPDAEPTAGCGVELTRLRHHSRVTWTIALEAFGPLRTLRAALLATCHAAFTDAPLSLGADGSEGYPRWLLRQSSISVARSITNR